jgi:asparagine synthase (glutamine-hydrolysing)
MSDRMNILLQLDHAWKTIHAGDVTIHHPDGMTLSDDVFRILTAREQSTLQQLGPLLREQTTHFSAIVERPDAILAFVDHCRTTPVFYADSGGAAMVSNSAHAVKSALGQVATNGTAALEFAMAGYVTGGETVIAGLQQLQAGELLIWEKQAAAPRRERYYRYLPENIRDDPIDVLTSELGPLTDRVMSRVIDLANGAPIWVPLSGGLDSRLIICKLVELGYDRLHAFSYGPSGNHEAKIARTVAEKLGVPWLFVPTGMAEARRFFSSETRREFWSFADGLSTVPNPQDLFPLVTLRQQGRLPDDAVLVNGQSGDFITGGHIPDALIDGNPDFADFLDCLIEKHFSFWRSLKTPANLAALEQKLRCVLGLNETDTLTADQIVAYFECWEWQERQSKYVVHGQRIYDFMGLAWQLPLWDSELMRFWQDIPVPLKRGQSLYRHYLRDYDYQGLFKDFAPYVWRWPGAMIAVVPLARLVGLVFGSHAKDHVYAYAKYLGHYRNHYATVDPWRFLGHATDARNALAFYAADWLEENVDTEIFDGIA